MSDAIADKLTGDRGIDGVVAMLQTASEGVYQGHNGWIRQPSATFRTVMERFKQAGFRVNALAATHAEGHVFHQALEKNDFGGTARLFLDAPLCRPHLVSGGFENLIMGMRYEKVELYTKLPDGSIEARVVTPQYARPEAVVSTPLLSWDCTDGSGQDVINPSWENVEAELLRMDGAKYTMIAMIAGDDRNLTIGGGNGRYVASVVDGDKIFSLKNPDGAEERYVYVIAGQGSFYPENQVVGLSDVMHAVRCYFDNSAREPGLQWIEW